MDRAAAAGILLCSMNGVLIIDKPAGVTSARVLDRVKRQLKARKAGHAGTLDPFATGVLVCCLNQATRLARFFLDSRKCYTGTLTLGVETDTQDATGEITNRGNPAHVTEADIRKAFSRFRGVSHQIPPAYSALKHRGVPLYKLARKGKPVVKPPREIHIDELVVEAVSLPAVRFRVRCSSGTYVRTLAADIGAALGCGAHLSALRRIQSGSFTLDQAVTLEDLVVPDVIAARVIPMADALAGMPACTAGISLTRKLLYGNSIVWDDLPEVVGGKPDPYLKVLGPEGRLLAVLEIDSNGDLAYCCTFPPPP